MIGLLNKSVFELLRKLNSRKVPITNGRYISIELELNDGSVHEYIRSADPVDPAALEGSKGQRVEGSKDRRIRSAFDPSENMHKKLILIKN